MEFPRRELIAERALAALMLAASLGAAWAQAGAPLAARSGDGKLWLAWVAARERGAASAPALSLAAYDPIERRLSVLGVPKETKLEGRRTLERAYFEALKAQGSADAAARAAEDLAEARLRELSPEPLPASSVRLTVDVPPLGDGDEPAVETARALKARSRSPRAWLGLFKDAGRGLRSGDRTALDPLIFSLELRRARVEPARLPDDAQAPELLRRLLTPPAPGDGRQIVVEVLNGTASPGLASRAKKVLKSPDVDVLTTENARPRARTFVYDRIGDFRRAEKVRALLRCPQARAMTRPDPSRAVDVSVELGDDCAGLFAGGASREP